MSNIFDFPPDRRDRATPGFLQRLRLISCGSTISDDESGRGLEATRPIVPDLPSRDWTNQELASIYRVRSLLEAAGVSTAVERGLSDEGEPWCVFCRADGEVFMHLCRIDGRYLLGQPELARPLAGDTFAELVDSFSDGALSWPPMCADTRRGRVVRLDRDGNVLPASSDDARRARLDDPAALRRISFSSRSTPKRVGPLRRVDRRSRRAGAADGEGALGPTRRSARPEQPETADTDACGDRRRRASVPVGGCRQPARGPYQAVDACAAHRSVAAGLSTIAHRLRVHRPKA